MKATYLLPFSSEQFSHAGYLAMAGACGVSDAKIEKLRENWLLHVEGSREAIDSLSGDLDFEPIRALALVP